VSVNKRYGQSTAMLERAEKVVPLGAQTFSKSRIQYPVGHAPLFIERGSKGRIRDVDGNEYVDLVCSLLAVILGYRDPDVDAAIRNQLDNGISFSLSTELEVGLSETLADLIPCAEMVRFGKNGSDATAGAVRLARAVTGRDRIAAGGYHGWQDWYIGATTRNLGVPDSVGRLTHKFPYNDLDALHTLLKQYPGDFAAVIMEPMAAQDPETGYLEGVRDLVHAHGGLLIFDEIITGFRFALGGAQELFGVEPDLACFGKSMANGMPISAVVGRGEYMKYMEDIFYSFTFGGETLSLAAAMAVIDKMKREPVIERLWQTGRELAKAVRDIISQYELSDVMGLVGKPCWTLIQFKDGRGVDQYEIKTFFLRGMLNRGVLINASHNVCYAHDEVDIAHVVEAYRGTLKDMAEVLDAGTLASVVGGEIVRPVFSIR